MCWRLYAHNESDFITITATDSTYLKYKADCFCSPDNSLANYRTNTGDNSVANYHTNPALRTAQQVSSVCAMNVIASYRNLCSIT